MSDEPERIFSQLGLIITDHQNYLKSDTIQAVHYIQSWDKAKIIDLLDKQLGWPKREILVPL
jgi:hypothetical protein